MMKLLTLLLLLHQFIFAGENAPPQRSIAVLARSDFQGEFSFAYRIQAACKNLNWKADILEIDYFKRLKKVEYDFVISLVPGSHKFRKSKYYLAIFHPLHHYFKRSGSLKKPYSHYDGYLLTYLPEDNDKNFVKHKLPYIPWYPTVQLQEYKEVEPTSLFHLCCIWGDRFNAPKMQRFLGLLDQEEFMSFYGGRAAQSLCPRKYCSSLPFDSDSVCEAARKAGASLILHSKEHNKYGVPSGRIFEAAAASAIIICDQNAFVKEYFGDSVLYINTEEDAESIYNQVKNHMNWIRLNKAEALEKAKKAYSIYRNHFLLEDQLLRLNDFHNQLSKNMFSRYAGKIVSACACWIKRLGTFLCMGWNGEAHAFVNPAPSAVLTNIDHQYSLINSVDFHPQKNVFCATYTHNNKISFFEVDENHQCHEIQTLHNPQARLSEPQHAVFSPNGEKLVVANWTNQTLNVYLREKNGFFCEVPAAIIQTPAELQRCKPHGIAFSPCGNYLAVAYGAANYFERGLALFKIQETRFTCISILKNADLPGHPKGVTFSPDGTHLLTTFCETNSLVIFNIDNQAIDPLPRQVIGDVAAGMSRPEDVKISSDGGCCAVTNSDQNTITFYPFDRTSNFIPQSSPSFTLQNPTAQLSFPHGIAFSADGSYLAITQFGRVQIDERGDISWDSKMKSSEAAINLYEILPPSLQN